MEKLRDQDASALPSAAASTTLRPTPSLTKRFAWFRKLGAGIRLDIRARAPWYISDWMDAWNYRVVPATALIFFAKYAQNPSGPKAANPQ
jgi:boron transporter